MIEKNSPAFDKAYNLFKEALMRKKLSASTILAYTTDLEQLCQFLKQAKIIDLAQVTQEHLANFQKKLHARGYEPISLARKLNAFRLFFDFLKEQKLINNNPLENVRSPKFLRAAPRILSPMEYRALRDICRHNPRTAALVEIFLQTGLRVSEVTNLNLADLKNNKLVIRPIKQTPQREIPLANPLKLALERYLKVRRHSECSSLFLTKRGTPLLVRNLTTIIMRCFHNAEIKDGCLNLLRHTWIYHQLLAGVPLEIVSRLAGHKRITTTVAYLNLIEKKPTIIKNKLKEL